MTFDLRKLLPYWRPTAKKTVAGISVLLLAAAVELLLPWPVKWLVDYVFESHTPPPWLTSLWPSFAVGPKLHAVVGVCLFSILLAVLHRTATVISQFLLIRVGGELVLQLRSRGYEQFCRLSLSYHDRTKVGDSLYRIAYDTQAAMTLISGALVPFLQGAIVLLGTLGIMLAMDLKLTAVAATIAPLFWVAIRFFSHRIERDSRRYHDNESELLSTLEESLSSMRALQAFTREPDTSVRLEVKARRSFTTHLRLIRHQLGFSASIGLLMGLGTAVAIWVGAGRVLAGELLPGDILVFLAYLGMLYQPMQAFSQSAAAIQSSRAQLGRVFEVLDQSPEIADRSSAMELPEVRGDVEFREVFFGYEPERPVLQGATLLVRRGEAIALVGPTGAGKSTLASLLLRFYDPAKGAVLLDGHDLRHLKLAWLRRQVSVVLQDALLLSGTVFDNIAYGRPEATLAEVQTAARLAQADAFIEKLPAGYQTNLAEKAVNLSGGQKQRIAIARAFLKDAPILILDEPTSALDGETEQALLESLGTLMRNRTTIIIAHRFSTIRLVHRIVMLDGKGGLVSGTHLELMDSCPGYRKLYEAQTLAT